MTIKAPGNDEERMRRIEWTLWGLSGYNGIVDEIKTLRSDLNAWKDQERNRREKQAQQHQTGALMVKLAAGSAILALILAGVNTIVTIGFG